MLSRKKRICQWPLSITSHEYNFARNTTNFSVYDNQIDPGPSRRQLIVPYSKSTTSLTPLVAMPSPPPQPDLYFKFIKMYTLHTLEMWDNNKITKLHIRFQRLKKLKSLGGWVGGKVRNVGHNESNCLPFGHMTQTQAFWSHDIYPGPQLCVRKTLTKFLLTSASGKLPFFSLC